VETLAVLLLQVAFRSRFAELVSGPRLQTWTTVFVWWYTSGTGAARWHVLDLRTA
jgi:hypothetical protein